MIERDKITEAVLQLREKGVDIQALEQATTGMDLIGGLEAMAHNFEKNAARSVMDRVQHNNFRAGAKLMKAAVAEIARLRALTETAR
jgi:hypothetical protein